MSFPIIGTWTIFNILLWLHLCNFLLALFLGFFRLYLNKVIGFFNYWRFAGWELWVIIFRNWIFVKNFDWPFFGKDSNDSFSRWWCLRVAFKVNWRWLLQKNNFSRGFCFIRGSFFVRICLDWLFFQSRTDIKKIMRSYLGASSLLLAYRMSIKSWDKFGMSWFAWGELEQGRIRVDGRIEESNLRYVWYLKEWFFRM